MKNANLQVPTWHDTKLLDSLTFSWISQHLEAISVEGARAKMDQLPPYVEGENIINTDDGPLAVTDTIRRLDYLLELHTVGMIDTFEWLGSIRKAKERLLRSFLQLELNLLLEKHAFNGYRRQISFRKGGVIVWRDEALKAAA